MILQSQPARLIWLSIQWLRHFYDHDHSRRCIRQGRLAYDEHVSRTCGSLTHTTVLTIIVGGFSISVSPSSLSLVQGSTDTFTFTLTKYQRFTGIVNLDSIVSRSSGLAVSCTSSSVVLALGGTATVICSATGVSNGNYTITLTGTSSPISHSASVEVRVHQH